jgi:hypothetical protein
VSDDEILIEVVARDDDTWDVVRHTDRTEVVSNHPQRVMAESERFRLVQAGATDPDHDRTDEVGVRGAYPDNASG